MFGPTLQTRIESVDTENTQCRNLLGTTVSLREKIEISLHRQQLDGFLHHQDIAELRYIADLWTRLLHFTSLYTIGCNFVKRDIITILLELYKLQQMTDCLFIQACLKL